MSKEKNCNNCDNVKGLTMENLLLKKDNTKKKRKITNLEKKVSKLVGCENELNKLRKKMEDLLLKYQIEITATKKGNKRI